MAKSGKISLVSAISIGIGGMVGGGIFAVLGLSVEFAKGAVPVAFLFAGIIALFTAFSYSKLSLAYPDRGGTVKFLNVCYSTRWISGGMNNLLWVSYIIMLALYSSAFGSYATSVIKITGNADLDFKIMLTSVILLCTLINYFSIKVVSGIESVVVIIKMTILMVFVFAGLIGITHNPNFSQLNPSTWETPFKIIVGAMVIFVAYEGFELIANSAPDIKSPLKNIPKAYILSVVIVVVLYILISIVTVGSLSFDKIGKAQDYALAEAAKPKFGQIGFLIISVAAMLSTFSAINATILGGSRVNYDVAKEGELYQEFTKQFWRKPLGLIIISIASLLMGMFVNLESISTSGSAGFLLIFGAVNYGAFKKRKELKFNGFIPLTGSILCILSFIILLIQQSSQLLNVLIPSILILLCFIGEYFYQKGKRKVVNSDSSVSN